jgi:hypothetical protein
MGNVRNQGKNEGKTVVRVSDLFHGVHSVNTVQSQMVDGKGFGRKRWCPDRSTGNYLRRLRKTTTDLSKEPM